MYPEIGFGLQKILFHTAERRRRSPRVDPAVAISLTLLFQWVTIIVEI